MFVLAKYANDNFMPFIQVMFMNIYKWSTEAKKFYIMQKCNNSVI